MKKYEILQDKKITTRYNKVLNRIRALIDIDGVVKKGELGGYIQSEANLSHKGKAWIADEAQVCDNAKVYGDAQVYGKAHVFGVAQVFGDAKITDKVVVKDNAMIYGKSKLMDSTVVSGNAHVYGWCHLIGNSRISGNGFVKYTGLVFNPMEVGDANDFTVYTGKDGNLLVSSKYFDGTADEFLNYSEESYSVEIYEKFKELIELAKVRIGHTKQFAQL